MALGPRWIPWIWSERKVSPFSRPLLTVLGMVIRYNSFTSYEVLNFKNFPFFQKMISYTNKNEIKEEGVDFP